MRSFKPKVIALGGSIIVPDKIDVEYLKRLRAFLLPYLEKKEQSLILVVGGGTTARTYQQAAQKVVNVSDEDKDWIGIHATRINAHLIRTIFADLACPVILDNPEKPISEKDREKYSLFIAAGGVPGHSTDYDAVAIAKRFGSKHFYIATTIPFIYNKDFSKHKDALPIKTLNWEKYRSLISDVWSPGMKAPIDPIAALAAQEYNMTCRLFLGVKFENWKVVFDNQEFEGSIIVP